MYSSYQHVLVRLSEQDEAFSIFWPCTSNKQGKIHIDSIYMEITSPLVFWLKRKRIPVSAEIRTYPNLLADRKDIAALLMKKDLGVHSHRQIGKGRDFEQLREYLPGDSFEDIHWKATAKRGTPITKVYQIERTQEIYIIIDASRLSKRQIKTPSISDQTHTDMPGDPPEKSKNETLFERFVNASLILGLAAERQGDLFGLITFSDRVIGCIKAKSGKAHFDACRDMLFSLEPQLQTPDFSDLFTFIGTHVRKRSLLLFLTSLDDPALAENFLYHLHLLSQRHVVLVNMIKPAGTQPVFSSPDIRSLNDIYSALGNHFVWQNLKELEKRIQRIGAGFSLLDNEQMGAQVISQYLNIKKRQIL